MLDADVEHTSQYRKLILKRFPATAHRVTSEERFWKTFKNTKSISHYAKVTDINFCPLAPHDLAVTASTRVFVYDGSTCAEKKTLSRFRDVAYSGSFRADGCLLVAGTADHYVKVFDMSSRTVLRHFKGHSDSVQVARFSSTSPTEIMSASDDTTVRLWDLPTYKHLCVFKGHRDHVRCAVEGASASTWLSGSFDHSVRLWDSRSGKMALKMEQGAPVESVVLLPGGGLIAAAGHDGIKIWDLLGGARMLKHINTHRKAVTSLAIDATNARLISGSIDQHVKFYDLDSYDVTHSIRYDSSILSVAISPKNTLLAVGMADGTLSVRRREVSEKLVEVEERQRKVSKIGSSRYFRSGDNEANAIEDFRIESVRRQKLLPYDQFLKSFQHKKALDAAVATHDPIVVASMLDELIQRNRLHASLSGRDEASLELFLQFLIRHITKPHLSKLLINVANVVFDLYGSMIGQSVLIDETFVKLRARVENELRLQNEMLGLVGSVDMLRSASNIITPRVSGDNIDNDVTTSISA